TRMPVRERTERYRDLIDQCQLHPGMFNLGDLYATYAEFLPRLNRRDEMPYYLRLGVQASIGDKDYDTACRLLGTLGCVHQAAFQFEEMRACWDQGLELARQTSSWQEARILGFYAHYHQGQGRLALARDLLLQAQDRCRDLGADEME